MEFFFKTFAYLVSQTVKIAARRVIFIPQLFDLDLMYFFQPMFISKQVKLEKHPLLLLQFYLLNDITDNIEETVVVSEYNNLDIGKGRNQVLYKVYPVGGIKACNEVV